MTRQRKYYALNSKELANSLAYIGFQYMKFDDYKYGKVYSFENTQELHDAIKELNKLKHRFENN